MNANELRIGNYVWENYGGVYLIRGIPDEKNVTVSKTKTTIAVSFLNTEVEPILLTEEWLLKLGFEKGSDIMGECYFIENATYDLDFAIHYRDGLFVWHNSDIQINYVHQLQNLFFAITNLELE